MKNYNLFVTLMITTIFAVASFAAPVVFQKELSGLEHREPEKLTDNSMKTVLTVDWILKDKSHLGAFDSQDPRQEFELYKGQASAIDVAALNFQENAEQQIAAGSGAAVANFTGGVSRSAKTRGRSKSKPAIEPLTANSVTPVSTAASADDGNSRSYIGFSQAAFFVTDSSDDENIVIVRNNDNDIIDTGSSQVPAPGALLLGSLGIGFVGWLRRKQQQLKFE